MDRDMTYQANIGEVTLKSGYDVEWRIGNIFSLFTGKNECHDSPNFQLSDCEWFFKIHPNGEGSAEHVALYLYMCDPSVEGVIFHCGVKNCDGTIDRRRSLSWIYEDENDDKYGYPDFLDRSQLVARKTELAPSDTLTITCTLCRFSSCNDFDSTADTGSLSENFLNIFTSQKGCDVTLQVRQEKFSAHKVILMARSPVFAAMFETPMKEKATGVVDIVDCDPEAFRDFLVYLYSGRLEKLSRHMFELYKIADKYDVQELKSQCLVAIMGNLSVENVFDVTIFAEEFNEIEIRKKSRKFFSKNFAKIVRTNEWKAFLEEKLFLANEMLITICQTIWK